MNKTQRRANICSGRPIAGKFMAMSPPPAAGETITAYNYATGDEVRYIVTAVDRAAGTYEAEPKEK